MGGISIFAGVATAFMFFPDLGRELTAYLITAILIVSIGLLDDQFDLKVRYRLLMQFIVSLVIIYGGDMRIEILGVFGSGGGFDLGLPGNRYRVFLGDAGRMLLGLTVAWLLINYTQDPTSKTFSPVTALWIIAVPLMDMLTIVTRRARNGKAPFRPDRNHLHHLFMNRGMSDRQALLAIIFAGIGILSEFYKVPHSLMLFAFLLTFAAYLSTGVAFRKPEAYARRISVHAKARHVPRLTSFQFGQDWILIP